MIGVVDADTHVIEHEGVWDNFDDGGEMYPYRPLLVNLPPDTSWGGRNAFWLVDGEMFPKSAGRNAFPSHSPTKAIFELERTDISLGARQMTDIVDRLHDMDQRGVAIQIVYPTILLRVGVSRADLEAAICRAYNRFMASACSRSEGRLRFVMVLPLQSIEASIAEINRARLEGAAGVFFRAVEADRSMADPYFYPIYEEATRLGLPICVHNGRAMTSPIGPFAEPFGAPQTLTALVSTKLPERFPDLKIGLIEFGSMWIPDTVHRLARNGRMRYRGPTGSFIRSERADRALFKDYRLYVTSFVDDDLPWILEYTGEDNLLIGSDYSHQDPAEEMSMVEELRGRSDIGSEVADKMLCDNPRSFYAL